MSKPNHQSNATIYLISFCLAALCLSTGCERKLTVTGSVFIVMKNGDNIKLAGAPVYVMSVQEFYDIQKTIEPTVNQMAKDLARVYVQAEEMADLARVYVYAEDSIKQLALEKRNALRKGEALENSYFDAFLMPVTKSDADGKFTLTLTNRQTKIIACRSQREVLGEPENYFWVIEFSPSEGPAQIMFCNDNLTTLYRRSLVVGESGSFKNELSRAKSKKDDRRGKEYTIKQEQERAEQEKERKRTAAESEQRQKEYEARFLAAEEKRKEDAAKFLAQKRAPLEKALNLNKSAAEKGDAFGQFRMGERYRDGDGVEKDERKAREYFTKSAAQGNTDAAKALEKMKIPPMP